MHTFPEDGTGENDSFIGNVETSEGVELKHGTVNKIGNEPKNKPENNPEHREIGNKTDRTRDFTYKSDLWTVLPGVGLLFLAVFVSQTIYFPRNLPKCDNPVETNEFHKVTENLLENSLENSLKNSLKTLTNSFENEKIAQNKQKSIQTQKSDSTRTIRHTPYNPDLIKTRFENRLSYYKTQCEAYLEADHKGTTKRVIDNGIDGHTSWMIYSRKNDLLLCAPPKTGTSNWQRSLVALEYHDYYTNTTFKNTPLTIEKIAGEVSPQTLFSLLSRLIDTSDPLAKNRKTLKSTESTQQILTSQEITRIMNVRHPFLRLHSAWTDKFGKNFNLDHDIRITKMFRHYDYVIWRFEDNANYPREDNARVSFYAFLVYLAKGMGFQKNVRSGFNGHWARYTQICWPCIVDYRYITRLETIDEDSRYLFDKAGFSEKIGYFPPAYNNSDSVGKVERIFNGLPEKLVDKLYELYYWDFKLFGYDKKNFTVSLTG